MADEDRWNLSSMLRDLRAAHGPLRTVLGPLALKVGNELRAVAERIQQAIPPEGWANIRQFVAEREDALARRERWVSQTHELAIGIIGADAPGWERVSMFWMRLYGLHDLRKQIEAEAATDADRTAIEALAAVRGFLTNDEWEVVRFLRNNEGHPWADRHAVHWDNRDGLTLHTRTFDGTSVHVRELAATRANLFAKHGGEIGLARALAARIESHLVPVIAAVSGQSEQGHAAGSRANPLTAGTKG